MRPPTVRVLVVDDERPIRDLLVRWAAQWGYTATAAPDADAAVELMSGAPVEILLCDVGMPGHDGLWLAEYVHTHWPETAIIMATATDDVDTVVQSRRIGAVDYVLKPFVPGLLRQALDRASGRLHFRPSVLGKTK